MLIFPDIHERAMEKAQLALNTGFPDLFDLPTVAGKPAACRMCGAAVVTVDEILERHFVWHLQGANR